MHFTLWVHSCLPVCLPACLPDHINTYFRVSMLANVSWYGIWPHNTTQLWAVPHLTHAVRDCGVVSLTLTITGQLTLTLINVARCQGCNPAGDCYTQKLRAKPGLCSACDSAGGLVGACCMATTIPSTHGNTYKDDSIECKLAEPQWFAATGWHHTCGLMPKGRSVVPLFLLV